MAQVFVFGDEAGNFDFSLNEKASKYFILTTVTIADCKAIESDLLELRRSLHWSGVDLPGCFHATKDKQAVRDQVFEVIMRHKFRIDSTVLNKRKTLPRLAQDEARFYKTAWYYHLKHLAPQIASEGDKIFLAAASITTHKKREAAHDAFKDVVQQTVRATEYQTAFWKADTDPCLQVADYCCWAIQRKWEMNDSRSYLLVAPMIWSEFDMFAGSAKEYY